MPRETISRTTDEKIVDWSERPCTWTDHKDVEHTEPTWLANQNVMTEQALIKREAWAIERLDDRFNGRVPHRMEGPGGVVFPAGLMHWMNETSLTGEQGMPKKNGNGTRKANGSKKSARAAK